MLENTFLLYKFLLKEVRKGCGGSPPSLGGPVQGAQAGNLLGTPSLGGSGALGDQGDSQEESGEDVEEVEVEPVGERRKKIERGRAARAAARERSTGLDTCMPARKDSVGGRKAGGLASAG